MKYSFLFSMFVVVGIIVGVMGLIFYFLFAKDLKQYLRGEEMQKCIKMAQTNNPEKMWTQTKEGKECMTTYQDVWIDR